MPFACIITLYEIIIPTKPNRLYFYQSWKFLLSYPREVPGFFLVVVLNVNLHYFAIFLRNFSFGKM